MLSATLSVFTFRLTLLLKVMVHNNYYCSIKTLDEINCAIFITFTSGGVCIGDCIIILIILYYKKCPKKNIAQKFESLIQLLDKRREGLICPTMFLQTLSGTDANMDIYRINYEDFTENPQIGSLTIRL